MATIKLKAPSGGSVSLVPQDTALDVTLTLPTAGELVSTSTLGAANGAALVGYTAGGTGAVPRTVEGKLRGSVSVSVSDYGALTDGSDATAAINQAILAAQQSKAFQLSYDEVYSVEVLFEAGQDYSVIGPILLPSGIVLNGRGCRLIGNIPTAGTSTYSDALPSLIETAFYDGSTITTNRGATLNTKRLVKSGIKGFTFLNANCAINAVQMNELSFIEGCHVNNVSAAIRAKNCYYLSIDGFRVSSSSSASNQYSILLHGGNHNAMRINRVSCGSGSSIGLVISGPASSASSITNCTFEESTGTGIYFSSDAYCLGWDISSNYFEGIRYGVVAAAGAGIYGVSIDNNFFSSCEYAVLASTDSIRVGSFLGNACPDEGGVIRNLVDFSAFGNDVRYQLPIKKGNTTSGPSAFLDNHSPSNAATVETSSVWLRVASPFDAIGKSAPGLANQNRLNELPFEGANIITVTNEPPFVSLVKAVNTLTVNTALTYDTSNILAFNYYGNTDSVNYDLKGFIFGTTVSWVTHEPIGVSLTVNDNASNVQLVFGNLTASIPVINVSGCVRHV